MEKDGGTFSDLESAVSLWFVELASTSSSQLLCSGEWRERPRRQEGVVVTRHESQEGRRAGTAGTSTYERRATMRDE